VEKIMKYYYYYYYFIIINSTQVKMYWRFTLRKVKVIAGPLRLGIAQRVPGS